MKITKELEDKIGPYVFQSQLALYVSGVHLGLLIAASALRLLIGNAVAVWPLDVIIGLEVCGVVLFYKMSRHFISKIEQEIGKKND